jgi:hypothetical protein
MSPWVFVSDWDLWSDIDAKWTNSVDDTPQALDQKPISGLVAGNIYKLTFTISDIKKANGTPGWAAADTFLRVNLDRDGNTQHLAYVANGTYESYIAAGTIDTNGLRMIVINPSFGDTLTISNVILEATVPGTSSDTIVLTGNLTICDPPKIGPAGTYERTDTIEGGRNVWASVQDHPHCADDFLVTWYFWYDSGNTRWVVSEVIGEFAAGDWTATSIADTPTDETYDPTGDDSTGEGTTFNEPSTDISAGDRLERDIRRKRYQ